MISIEIYEGAATEIEDYFRIIYNGIPQYLPSCGDQSLCEIRHLLKAMDFGFTQCPVGDPEVPLQWEYRGIVFDGSDYSIILFLTLLLGILIGAVVMKFQMEASYRNTGSTRENFMLLSDQSSHDGSMTSSSSSSSQKLNNHQHQGEGIDVDSDEDEIYMNAPPKTSHNSSKGSNENEMVDFRI